MGDWGKSRGLRIGAIISPAFALGQTGGAKAAHGEPCPVQGDNSALVESVVSDSVILSSLEADEESGVERRGNPRLLQTLRFAQGDNGE
jgi:hypothetical protein